MLAEYWSLITNPAHSLVEFTFVLLDYAIIQTVASQLKRHFHKDIQREHATVDAEHGYSHTAGGFKQIFPECEQTPIWRAGE